MPSSILSLICKRFFELSEIAKSENIPRVFISDISSSVYCEWRKVLELRYGKVDTDEMVLGRKLHEEFFSYDLTDVSKIDSLVLKGERVGVATRVGLMWKDRESGVRVFITGEPDLIIFSDGKIERIVELKTRKKAEVYSSDIIQLGLYSICIENMVGGLPYDINLEVIVKSTSDEKSFSETFLFSDVKNFVFEEFKRIMEFFLGKRPPSISSSHKICLSCPYKNVCEKRLEIK